MGCYELIVLLTRKLQEIRIVNYIHIDLNEIHYVYILSNRIYRFHSSETVVNLLIDLNYQRY